MWCRHAKLRRSNIIFFSTSTHALVFTSLLLVVVSYGIKLMRSVKFHFSNNLKTAVAKNQVMSNE